MRESDQLKGTANNPTWLMQRIAIIFVCLFACLLCNANCYAEDYKMDFNGPLKLDGEPLTIPMPTKCVIVRSKPTVGIDYSSAVTLIKAGHYDYTTTTNSEIVELIHILYEEEEGPRIRRVTENVGITWHVIFIQEYNKTLIQYDVFEPEVSNPKLCIVCPVTLASSRIPNYHIGDWLHLRIKHPERLP